MGTPTVRRHGSCSRTQPEACCSTEKLVFETQKHANVHSGAPQQRKCVTVGLSDDCQAHVRWLAERVIHPQTNWRSHAHTCW